MNKRPKRLAVVGASVRAAAWSARRAGFEVVAADLFADRDLQAFCDATRIKNYPHGLVDWLAAQQVDAWLYTGALENHPELIQRMEDIAPLWGCPSEVVRRVRDFETLSRSLHSAGLRVPETVSSADGLPLDGSWLCKTNRSSSGAGVWRLDGEASLARAGVENARFQRALDRSTGTPASVLYFIGEHDVEMIGATQQIVGEAITGAFEFQYAGSLWPLPISQSVRESLLRLGEVLQRAFDLRGMVGVDVWLGDRGLWILEVNPRYTAAVELLERATGVAALGQYSGACRGSSHQPDTPHPASGEGGNPTATGKLILFAKQEIVASQGFSDWALACDWIADVPHPGDLFQQGWPVVTIFGSGRNPSVEGLFSRRVEVVEQRLYAGL